MRFLVIFFLMCTPSLVGTQEKPLLLLLGLDGISYQIAEELYDGGFFRNLQRPIPLVASFPSISDPNWAKIMNAPLEKSYTKAHFSKTKNPDGTIGQEVGTIINHLVAPPAYEKHFDFRPQGVFQHLMSVTWAQTSALYWMDSLSKILLKKENIKKDIYSAFIMNTDIIAHVGGKKDLIDYLQKVSKRLIKLQKDFKKKYNRKLEILIVSDHGNYFKKPIAIEFEKVLSAKKWNKKSSLKEPTDYGFVAPEIISFAAFYTLDNQEEKLAKLFTEIKGVHVSLTSKEKDKINVFSPNGQAEITVFPKEKSLSYRIINGADPFKHLKHFNKNKKLSFKDYFYATLEDPYPNALVRAWEAFYQNAQQPASVLVSPELGYVFTNATLELLTLLSGVNSSHGSFHREESLGLIFSSIKNKNEALEPHYFLDYLKELGYQLSE